jgi:P-type Ca2+ transporter type 2C
VVSACAQITGMMMMAGTLGSMHYGRRTDPQDRALALAFTTLVLFRLFNVFDARFENSSAINARLLETRILWLSLAGVIVLQILQILMIHWPSAPSLFNVSSLRHRDRALETAVAASVLPLGEARKLGVRAPQ